MRKDMAFYEYEQMNSGGTFICHDNVDFKVIIEADSAGEANEIAESKGIYFDGCRDLIDCPCCGDRWRRAYEPLSFPVRYNDEIFETLEEYCKAYPAIIYKTQSVDKE